MSLSLLPFFTPLLSPLSPPLPPPPLSDGLRRSQLHPSEALLAGAAAGAAESLVSTPFALLTTRLQLRAPIVPPLLPSSPLSFAGPAALVHPPFTAAASGPVSAAIGLASVGLQGLMQRDGGTVRSAAAATSAEAASAMAAAGNASTAAVVSAPVGVMQSGPVGMQRSMQPKGRPATLAAAAGRATAVASAATAAAAAAGAAAFSSQSAPQAPRTFTLSLSQYPWLPVTRSPARGELHSLCRDTILHSLRVDASRRLSFSITSMEA